MIVGPSINLMSKLALQTKTQYIAEQQIKPKEIRRDKSKANMT